jgi:PPOX class probable F420-dependent enzyme
MTRMDHAYAPLAGPARSFLEEPGRFGVLASVNPDGTPHQCVIWYRVTDGGILLNSAVGRRWPANLQRDPRASLLVEDGYQYVVVRGAVEVLDDPVRALVDISDLARLYHRDEPETAERLIRDVFATQRRVSFLLRPRSVSTHND